MEGPKSIECPICSKEFSSSIIEAHVEECMLSNEPPKVRKECFLKRPSSDQSSSKSPTTKRAKTQFFPHVEKPPGKSTVNKSNENRTKEFFKKNAVAESSKKISKLSKYTPLAEKVRPNSLLDYVGQTHILGKQSMLLQLLEKQEIPNIVLWGPPGCGKTSLANVIANICKNSSGNRLRFVKHSAAMNGISDIKETVQIAMNELKFGRRTILFMDEIHRFNKLQQDVFLPHLESGTITLIGATTENPSFSMNSPLLSRCRVIVLEKLTTPNLVDILTRAVETLRGKIKVSDNSSLVAETSTNSKQNDIKYEQKNEELSNIENEKSLNRENGHLNDVRFFIDSRTIEWLAETCDGDARIALGGLELAILTILPNEEESSIRDPKSITLDEVKEGLKKSHMLYDRKGDQHYDMISALHKSVRASDENAALYWLARMMAGGEDPVYIARRLVRMSCEDIGLEDPTALGIAVDTMHGCKMIGMPECDVLLAQCVVYLARAPKSRLMENALRAAQRFIDEHKGPQPGVPLHLRNAPTKLMKDIGCGRGYNMSHRDESGLNYMPEGLECNFFEDAE